MFLRDSSKQELGQALTQGHKEPPGETLRTKPAGLPAPKGVRCQLAKAQGAPNPPQPCQGSPAKLSPVLCRRWSFIPPLPGMLLGRGEEDTEGGEAMG